MAYTLGEDRHLTDPVLTVSETASTSFDSATIRTTQVAVIERYTPFHSDTNTPGRWYGWQRKHCGEMDFTFIHVVGGIVRSRDCGFRQVRYIAKMPGQNAHGYQGYLI